MKQSSHWGQANQPGLHVKGHYVGQSFASRVRQAAPTRFKWLFNDAAVPRFEGRWRDQGIRQFGHHTAYYWICCAASNPAPGRGDLAPVNASNQGDIPVRPAQNMTKTRLYSASPHQHHIKQCAVVERRNAPYRGQSAGYICRWRQSSLRMVSPVVRGAVAGPPPAPF